MAFEKIKNIWNKTPWYIKNPYFMLVVLFVVWMSFFDNHNVFDQWKTSQEISKLQDQQKYYEEQIEEIEQLKTDLFSTDESIEKFARETYYMKKDNEDVFIIVDEE